MYVVELVHHLRVHTVRTMMPRAAGKLERHGDGDSDDGKRCSVAFTPPTKHTSHDGMQ